MEKVVIEQGYRVTLPDQVRSLVQVGGSVQVTTDENGRIILTPDAEVRDVLLETFGMWADREDLPVDSITYVDQIRQGHRLNERVPDDLD